MLDMRREYSRATVLCRRIFILEPLSRCRVHNYPSMRRARRSRLSAQVSAATSVLVYRDGKTLARVGVMGESAVIKDAPILRKCFRDGLDGREQYLAALQVISCFPCDSPLPVTRPCLTQLGGRSRVLETRMSRSI